MKAYIVLSICLCLSFFNSTAQNVQFSAAQKIGVYNHFNIVGASSLGVMVHQFGKSGHILEQYNSNMILQWRKPFPLTEHIFNIIDIDLYNDTLRVIYTSTTTDKEYLKCQLFDINLSPLHIKPIILDSFKNGFTENNSIEVSYSISRKYALIYLDVYDFGESYNVPYHILDNQGYILVHQTIKVNTDFKNPSLCDAFVYEDKGMPNVCFLYGEYAFKNTSNDFPFSKYGITFSGSTVSHFVLKENEWALSSGDYKWDYVQNRLVICGLYATEPGISTTGTFFSTVKPNEGILAHAFTPLSTETNLQLNGEVGRKSKTEMINFKVKGLTLRNDGGCILECEQIYQTTETFRNTSYSFYGVASPTTLSFYHYDDLFVASFASDGLQQWTKVLHKKQESEGDGGYYLSHCQTIGEKNLTFLYNDGTYSNASFASYTLGPTGAIERHEYFNNERKAVMMIPQFGKQVSYNEIVVPSIRKNMLQFIKFVL